MREAVGPSARKPVELVEDPYETVAARPIRTRPEGHLALAWFGNLGSPNADGLRPALAELARNVGGASCRVELVPAEESPGLGIAIADAASAANRRWSVVYTA